MEITKHIFQVGGSEYSHGSDGAVYLIKSKNEAALIDAGTGSGTVNIIDSVSYEGNSCVYMQNVIIPDPWQVEESLIEIPIYFEKDTEYELSFWYKISGIARMDHHTLYFYYFQDEENHFETNLSFELGSDFWAGEWIPDGPFKILDDTGWLNYTKTLVPTNNSPAIFNIGGQIENIKLDNLSIKVKE